MDTVVEFESELFKPFLPEDAQVNPHIYGAELAFWLARQLAAHGIATSYPNNEDWGWFIEYITADGDEYWLCCSNLEGQNTQWLCFLDPKAKGWFGRHPADPDKARPMLDALRAVLENEPAINHIQWREDV